MRLLTLAAVCAAALLTSGTAHAQLFRGRASSSGGCANGSCGLPQSFAAPQFSAPQAYSLPGATIVGDGHTHTCPRCGTTWDHSTNPGHNCPRCGTAQYIQDSPRRATTFNPSAPPLYVPQAREAPKPVPPVAARATVSYCGCGESCPCAGVSAKRGAVLVTFVP